MRWRAGDEPYGPAGMANPFIAPNTIDSATGNWWMCDHCSKNQCVRGELLAPMMPDYTRAVLCGEPCSMMLLSFLDSPVTLSKWSNSFTHGYVSSHLWDSPLIRFSRDANGKLEAQLDRYVLRVLEFNLKHNTYYRVLSCLVQMGFVQYGHPCVDLSFFGVRTLATMHQADNVLDQAAFATPGFVDRSGLQYGILDSSLTQKYRKDSLFEVRVMVGLATAVVCTSVTGCVPVCAAGGSRE